MDTITIIIIALVCVLIALLVLWYVYKNVTVITGSIEYKAKPSMCVSNIGGKMVLDTCATTPEQTFAYNSKSGQIMYAQDQQLCVEGPPDGSAGQLVMTQCGTSPAQQWTYDATSNRFRSGSNCMNLLRSYDQQGGQVWAYPCQTPPATNEAWTYAQ